LKHIGRQKTWWWQCRATLHFVIDFAAMTGTKSWLPLHESPSSHWAKDECNWRKSLQHLRHVCTAKPDCDVCSWRAQTSKKHCIEYLHSPPGSTLQSPEAAHMAVLTLPKQLHHQWQHSSVSSSRLFFQWRWSHGSFGWSWWSSTKHHQLGQHCGATTEACRTAGSPSPWWCYCCQHCSPSYYNNTSQKCSSTGCLQLHAHQAKPICVAGGRHTDWKVCKTALPALLACCAVFAQKLVRKGSYTRGPTQVATGNTPTTSWLQILINRWRWYRWSKWWMPWPHPLVCQTTCQNIKAWCCCW